MAPNLAAPRFSTCEALRLALPPPDATYHPHPGWAGQDPSDWWETLVASVRKVLDQTGIPVRHIAGISYDATTMSVVPINVVLVSPVGKRAG